MKLRFGCIVALMSVVAFLTQAAPALAQLLPDVGEPYTYAFPPNTFIDVKTLSNSYVQLNLAAAGIVVYTDPSGTQHNINMPGRWVVSTVTGDPLTSDKNVGLIWNPPFNFPNAITANCPFGNTGYFKLNVNNQIYLLGDDPADWSVYPEVYTNPPTGYGRTGPFIGAAWSVGDSSGNNISVGLKASLVRDLVRFEMDITNSGGAAANVGMQMTSAVQVSNSVTVGYPFLPGLGMLQTPSGVSERYGLQLNGTTMPSQLDFFDSVQSPVAVARTVITDQDSTPPDYAAIGEYGDIAPTGMWLPGGYNPSPILPVDVECLALTWAQEALGPGATRKIVTYYGVGAATSMWTTQGSSGATQDYVCLAVEGPRSLRYDATSSNPGENDLNPAPFNVRAYVYNLDMDPGPYDLENVTATLFLPPGLSLSSNTVAQQQIGTVARNTESTPVVWEVVPDGKRCGELTYYVVAEADNGWQQVVSRTVMIPATTSSNFTGGWQLIGASVYFQQLCAAACDGPAVGDIRGGIVELCFGPVSGGQPA